MLQTIRNRYLFLSDLVLLAAGPLIAGALRFESLAWAPAYVTTVAAYAVLALPLKLATCFTFGH